MHINNNNINKDIKIVFMGTPDFAAVHLQAMLDHGYTPVGVFTQPDKARGRGMHVTPCPVKALADAHEIPVWQPEKLRDGTALAILESLQPDLLVVVAYGRILPEAILQLPRLGCINVHGSLLPKYRGSAPIQWAVLNGEDETGVSTMYLAPEMDAGDIIYTASTPIGLYETSEELYGRLADLGAALLLKTLPAIVDGSAPRTPQDHALATYAPPLEKSQSPINWNRPARAVLKQICGLIPWPVATCEIDGETCRIFRAALSEERNETCAPGSFLGVRRTQTGEMGLLFACGGGETLLLLELQRPGKKRMGVQAYLAGHPLEKPGRTV